MNKRLKKSIRNILMIGLISTSTIIPVFANNNESYELNEDVVQEIENIEYYQTPQNLGKSYSQTNEVVKTKYADAMKIVEKYYKSKNEKLSNDLNDIEYQQKVIILGSDLEVFKEKEKGIVLEFVKFMDLYENIEKNNQIEELLNKYRKGSFTSTEVDYLISLAPIPSEDTSTLDINLESNETYALFKNGYDSSKAVNYAYTWTDNYKTLRNTAQYGYYNVGANDCTNFVSQCLKAGGMKYRGSLYTSSSSWFYNNIKPSHTWGGAKNFYNHWKTRAGVVASVTALRGGDVVQADFHRDGDIDHTAIITRNTATSTSNTSSHKYLTQHTTDREEYHKDLKIPLTLKYWYNSGYRVYGYEMDKASN